MTTFLPIARIEADNAAERYEKQQAGLGYEFLEGLENGIARIADYPEAFQIVLAPHHRPCLLKRFPYDIIFRF